MLLRSTCGFPLGRGSIIERVRLAEGIAMSFDETYLLLDIGEKIASDGDAGLLPAIDKSQPRAVCGTRRMVTIRRRDRSGIVVPL